MRALVAGLAFAASLMVGSCDTPPPDAYLAGGSSAASEPVSVGRNTTGEECGLQRTGDRGEIYCGTWKSPSARIHAGEAKDVRPIDELVASSPWRADLDGRLRCDAPVAATVLQSEPARILPCRKLTSGFSVIAFVTVIGGKAWFAEGVENARPTMERAVGVMAGLLSPETASAQIVANAAAGSVASSDDQAQYETLARRATNANRLADFASAETAWRGILDLQERLAKQERLANKGGGDNPAMAFTLMSLAVQISNQGKFADAEPYFERADRILTSPGSGPPDSGNIARYRHYYAVHLLNKGNAAAAVKLLQEAEKLYDAQADIPDSATGARQVGLVDMRADGLAIAECAANAARCSALAGIVEVKRNLAWAYRLLGQVRQSQDEADDAKAFAEEYQGYGLAKPAVEGYVLRTVGLGSMIAGQSRAAVTLFGNSSDAFDKVVPGSFPAVEAMLLRASEQFRLGDDASGLASCRGAVADLGRLQREVDPTLMKPCLEAFAQGSQSDPARVTEFFTASQMMRDSQSRQFLQSAAARLSQEATDPKAGAAIRTLQDIDAQLGDLNIRRGRLEASSDDPTTAKAAADLDKEIGQLTRKKADAEQDVQAASPNYGQLVETVTSIDALRAVLRQGEAFAVIKIVGDDAWTFVLRGGTASVAPVAGGRARIDGLVKRFRASVEGPDHPFDIDAAQQLYAVLFGPFGALLDDATSLVVNPSGSLLEVPLGALLTGPGDATSYATAPWLLRRMAVTTATSASSFVLLRGLATRGSAEAATKPWIGFGDFRPVTLLQARASFDPAKCGDSAALFASLPPLPDTKLELDRASQLVGATAADEVTGAAFTADAVMKMPLRQYRIVHFATHGLLPSDLACEPEPAIVTSPPAGATDAKGAQLTALEVLQLKLSADLVLLSACNTGGSKGEGAGESLENLARSFFYAGARDMLATHWDVASSVATAVIPLTLQQMPQLGPAEALREVQLQVIDKAPGLQHPYYWAPFAILGQGAGPIGKPQASAMRAHGRL